MIPLLGLSWFFGLMAVDRDTVVFQYLFVGLNSLQVSLKIFGILVREFGRTQTYMDFRDFTKLTLVYSTTRLYYPVSLFVVVVVVVAVQSRAWLFEILIIPFSFFFLYQGVFLFLSQCVVHEEVFTTLDYNTIPI